MTSSENKRHPANDWTFSNWAELGFVYWFNGLYGTYSLRSEWFEGDCETEDLNQRKEILRKWVHAAFVAGYELGREGRNDV